MSTPSSETPRPKKPTADDLAGIPVCLEEDHPTIRVREPSQIPPLQPAQSPPTADDLAGIPVCAEAEEDLTVRPRRVHPKRS
jgi:hypothetical protein